MAKQLTRLSLFAGALALIGSAAQAGQCPADKVTIDGQKPGATVNAGATDSVIASIDLAEEAPGLKEHALRLRRLVIEPGGTVAWHSHAERPAIIYIVSGSITEYRSTCAAPIVHNAGEATEEIHTVSHWWKNHTKKPVVLLSADILHAKKDDHHM